MTKKHFVWDYNSPDEIQQHSIAKHEILKSYLISYVQTLISPRQTESKFTLVDGFSGGGIYRHKDTNNIVYGSPIIMLDAIKEANFLINQKYGKSIDLKVDYFFVDNNKDACNCLKYVLKDKGYDSLINKSIFILEDSFINRADNIIASVIKKTPKSKRAIFLLDQYGYVDAPTSLIRKILTSLPNSEIILNFNVDALLKYATDKNGQMQNLLNKIGIPNALKDRSTEDIKNSVKDRMLLIQSCLHQELIEKCGAPYYTPFFIRSSNGYGDYWLIHLSQHPRAHDVMKQIHWQKNNYFIHYGSSGLDMFSMIGYVPKRDNSYIKQAEFDFCFDDVAQKTSIDALLDDIPHLICSSGDKGISFAELFAKTCNNSPASTEIYKKAIGKLIDYKEIEVISEKGSKRQAANAIHDTDTITMNCQKSLFIFLNFNN